MITAHAYIISITTRTSISVFSMRRQVLPSAMPNKHSLDYDMTDMYTKSGTSFTSILLR